MPRAQKQNLDKSHGNMAIKQILKEKNNINKSLWAHSLPTTKCPEVHHFTPFLPYQFQYSLFKVKKSYHIHFCINYKIVLFLPKFAHFGAQIVGEGFFPIIHFSVLLDSKLHAKFQENPYSSPHEPITH